MITAGRVADINWLQNKWVFLDIGFSSQNRSCGIAFGDDPPQCVQFGVARQRILEQIDSSTTGIELVIEAPLSVCFDSKGNPKGRTIELEATEHRYWYESLGCAVMVAAIYLVRDIYDLNAGCQVRLFEGFVSFKNRGVRSKHLDDVCLLKEVVRGPRRFSDYIFPPEKLKSDPADVLASAFRVAGMDCGVPAVIKR